MSDKKIAILCSSNEHPIFPYLFEWVNENVGKYRVFLVNTVSQLPDSADILFLVSCNELVNEAVRKRFGYTLVLHASALPKGRGWSPHIWDILNGENQLTLSLLNAEDKVDSGDIWKQLVIFLDGSELYDQINQKLFEAELNLMTWACENVEYSRPRVQVGETTYYPKRAPADSKLDPDKTIAEQFELLRVCDPKRFPAFFDFRGERYSVKLEKMNNE